MLDGALFKKFGLFLNTPRISHTWLCRSVQSEAATISCCCFAVISAATEAAHSRFDPGNRLPWDVAVLFKTLINSL
jgi:hypothetical protein